MPNGSKYHRPRKIIPPVIVTPPDQLLESALSVVGQNVLQLVKSQYAMEWDGIHGFHHWMRVRYNGLTLAENSQANKSIIELFAILHDSCRTEDGKDYTHGPHAALFIKSIDRSSLQLSEEEVNILAQACYFHSEPTCQGNSTMKICYDADRLDLGRWGVEIEPHPKYLCTESARVLILQGAADEEIDPADPAGPACPSTLRV